MMHICLADLGIGSGGHHQNEFAGKTTVECAALAK